MAKDEKPDAWMPLYVGDWDGDTGHLSNEQDGAYGRLVRWYWRNGPLPDDDAMLANVIRTDMRTWRRLRPVLASFFTVAAGMWRHKRVEEELERWSAKKAKAIERAETAAAARWSKQPAREQRPKRPKNDATSNATSTPQALLEQCPSPTVEETLNRVSSHSDADDAARLDGATTPAVVIEKPPLEERQAQAAEVLGAFGLKRIAAA